MQNLVRMRRGGRLLLRLTRRHPGLLQQQLHGGGAATQHGSCGGSGGSLGTDMARTEKA